MPSLQMERLLHRLLLAWLALLAALLLSLRFAPALSYGLLLAVAIGCPVVVGLLLGLVALGLRGAWRRARVLRRAAKWRREQPDNREWLGRDR
ncbi:hypothetical protein [Hymenobacter ruricola]|uniref:DUF4229 domain-containing protein n=1 Tax=Hymenobacter ruricola TaxID=2791023 RepID=A0ABS0HYS2_9BACT|nr:hypothetical protein [Hymenobacter ruricola]MBF9219696.1 hypothetical protein [Hymenobacter ruricola]